MSARRTHDAETGGPTIHWEIRDRSAAAAPARPPLIQRDSTPAVTVVAAAAARLATVGVPADLAEQAAREALLLIPAADDAAVLTLGGRGRIAVAAATGEGAARGDRQQLELDEGPSISALARRAPMLVADVARDERWPRLAELAPALGIRSVLAAPLIGARGTVGVLTLYASAPAVFEADDAVIAAAFAGHVGVMYTQREVDANLRVALETREAVGQAVGILMERYRLPATAAFDRLVAVSQHSHRKLRDVAQRVVETGEDPETIVVPPLG